MYRPVRRDHLTTSSRTAGSRLVLTIVTNGPRNTLWKLKSRSSSYKFIERPAGSGGAAGSDPSITIVGARSAGLVWKHRGPRGGGGCRPTSCSGNCNIGHAMHGRQAGPGEHTGGASRHGGAGPTDVAFLERTTRREKGPLYVVCV